MIHILYSSLNIKKVTESRRRQIRHAACTKKRNTSRILWEETRGDTRNT
jgi:hypothetical protein